MAQPPPTPPAPPPVVDDPAASIRTPDDVAQFEDWLERHRHVDDTVALVARGWHDAGVDWSRPDNRRALSLVIRRFVAEDERETG